MGIIRQGFFGGFEGKTGALIGRRVKGKSLISGRRHNPTSIAQTQLDQQLKFKLVVSFLKGFKDLIRLGFKGTNGKKYSFSVAIKYNFNLVLTGSSPDYRIDCTKLVFSKGALAGLNNPSVILEANELLLSWLPDTQTRFNQHTDQAQFVVYCPDKALTIIYRDYVVRAALGCSLALPIGLEGCDLHVFMSLVNANGKVVSNSVYLGAV
jgi:hypothetical protein